MALADYNRVDVGEISMKEGDLLEVLKIGNEGWWYVRLVGAGEEGWAPASYMDSAKRRSSHSTFSMSSSGKVIEQCSAPGLHLANSVLQTLNSDPGLTAWRHSQS